MIRSANSYLLFIAALAVTGSCSMACINDIELPQHEREFRSQYDSSMAPSLMTYDTKPPRVRLIAGSGWLFLGAAAVLCLKKQKEKSA